jgi:hypothetical protein
MGTYLFPTADDATLEALTETPAGAAQTIREIEAAYYEACQDADKLYRTDDSGDAWSERYNAIGKERAELLAEIGPNAAQLASLLDRGLGKVRGWQRIKRVLGDEHSGFGSTTDEKLMMALLADQANYYVGAHVLGASPYEVAEMNRDHNALIARVRLFVAQGKIKEMYWG